MCSLLGPGHQRMLVHRNGVFRCFRNIIQPPCDCLQCLQQFRSSRLQGLGIYTYAESLSDKEAQDEAFRFLRSMSENIQYLKEQCSVNGNTIMKRWRKSRKKRNSYLISVDPNLYPHEWCNLHFLKDFQEKKIASNSTGEVDVDIT